MKKLFPLLVISIFFSGCTTVQTVNKVEPGKVSLVCIAEHKEVRENVLEVIQEGLTNHGVRYKVIPASYQLKNKLWMPTVQLDQTAGCDAVLFYVANWTWDITMYMHFANVWMATPNMQQRLGDASYDARASLNKFINARAKILELVDGLFAQYRNVDHVNAKVILPVVSNTPELPPKAPQATQTTSGTTSAKLRELQTMKNDGLISDADYERKKKQLLDQL